MNYRRAGVAILVAVLILGAAAIGFAAIANYSVPAQGEIPVTTDETPTVVIATDESTDLNLVDIWEGDELNITTEAGAIVVSGDSGASVRIDENDIEGTTTQVTDIDAGANWIELDPADKNRVDVRGDVDTLAFGEIGVNDGATDLQVGGTVDGTADLRIHDLTANEEYALYDSSRDEVLGYATADGDGTLDVSADLPDGSHALQVRTTADFAAPTLSNPVPEGDVADVPEELAVDVTAEAFPADVEIELDGQTVHTETITEDTTVTADISGEIDDARVYDWTATVTDGVDTTDTLQTSFDTSAIDEPTLSNPSPEGDVTEMPDELSVDVDGVAFPIEIEFRVDDDVVHTESVSEAGTVTADVTDDVNTLGAYDWSVTATDDIGQTDTIQTGFQTPDVITIREEHDPQTIVDDSTVTMRFFTVGGEIAVEREVEDGVVGMDELPDSQFVVFVESDGHYDRTIFIDSIFDQENMFLLNETEFQRGENDAVRSRFVYEDLTGNFPTGDTTLQIQRAIDMDGDNESEYMTVAGDFWGAANEFETVLERGERYRLVLVNQESGERHLAGTHIPTEDLSQTVRISGLVEEAQNESGIVALADLREADNEIKVLYSDPGASTDELTIVVESRGGSDVIYDETHDITGEGAFAETIALNESEADQDWVVVFESDIHRSAVPVGSGTVGLPVAVPGWLMTLLMSMAVTFVGALYGPRTALLGAWAMVFVAAGVAMFGWAFSGASVIVAALVAVGATLTARAMP